MLQSFLVCISLALPLFCSSVVNMSLHFLYSLLISSNGPPPTINLLTFKGELVCGTKVLLVHNDCELILDETCWLIGTYNISWPLADVEVNKN